MTIYNDGAITTRVYHHARAFGRRRADDALPPEFLLTAACCRWPPSEARNAEVQAAAARVVDWNNFLQVVGRHRVAGLVHDALSAAEIELPPNIAEKLASRTEQITRNNLLHAAELSRLQRAFDAAQIPVLVQKGAALAQLAYGSLNSKHARDIDLLVPPDRAETALKLVEREGYVPLSPANRLGEARRRAVVEYGREVDFAHRDSNLHVELKWRLADNSLLLKGIDTSSPLQTVLLSDGLNVRTLAPDDLFAYLCVHGAYHAWARLKWLADLNAMIATKDADVAQLYRHAQGIGAGLCAGQALLLCHWLFGLKLRPALAAELQRNRRISRLVNIAMHAMTKPHTNRDGVVAVTTNVFTQFLLGQGWAFYAAQCRVASVGILDVVTLPLPRSLHFLYPLLRLPLWLWRRTIAGRKP